MDSVLPPKPNSYGPGFVQLSSTVFYHESSESSNHSGTSTTAQAPNLIILAAWMNALPKHVAKYTSTYENLFPSSHILVIVTNTAHLLTQPERQRIKDLEPALSIIQGIQPHEKVLLHAFSNGGASAIWTIARTHHARTGKRLPVSKTVFDSMPGSQSYEISLAAFTVALPKNLMVRAVGSLVLRVFLGMWYVYDLVTRSEKFIDKIRNGLNDTRLFDVGVERLYIYSMADKLVPWKAVEEHAREAEGMGFKVSMEKYRESGHCAHLLDDEKRYWGAVVDTLWLGRDRPI
ncbi:indole-diterpene biosynthesis protein [Rutstroemia sp. NJR-2017a BVV2]|nr:indole-diterpene biosynthesis protein [Rutstroemia sp. NJR-2017a BVV2]